MWKVSSIIRVVRIAAVLLPILAFAQDGVQISRPLDGATVRETVNILVPVSSVPVDGFVSYSIDGRFRSASGTRSSDSMYFVYRWDTKAMDPDTNLPQAERIPRDGEHIIDVQAYRSDGRKFGPKKGITVYVKNNASADMPSEGLRLRYKHSVGRVNKYHFMYGLGIKSIQGGTTAAASMGENIEGAEGTVKRSVEDIMPDGGALIRQKLIDTFKTYQGGRAIPVPAIIPKAGYHVEDSSGRITYVMTSTSPGASITIDLPNLPEQKVRIGDTWIGMDRVLRNSLDGSAAILETTSTLEGLEWEMGYPCAKIKTTFSGIGRVPFSAVFTAPAILNGEMITYFAYEVGKVVSSVTTATAEMDVDPGVVGSLTQTLMPQGATPSPIGVAAPSIGPGPYPSGIGGPPGMEGPPGYTPSQPYMSLPPGAPGPSGEAASQTVRVTLDVKQVVELER